MFSLLTNTLYQNKLYLKQEDLVVDSPASLNLSILITDIADLVIKPVSLT